MLTSFHILVAKNKIAQGKFQINKDSADKCLISDSVRYLTTNAYLYYAFMTTTLCTNL